MKLTKKEKQLCIDKWQWFYDHPTKYYINDLPNKLVVELDKYECWCPLCEYNRIIDDDDNCRTDDCFVLNQTGYTCDGSDKSYWYKWRTARTFSTRKKYAGLLLEIMKQL